MTSSLIMPSSTTHPSPLTARRCTTITRPDHQQGLVIEYTLINPPGSPPSESQAQQFPSPSNDTRLPPLRGAETGNISYSIRKQRPWLGLAATPNTTTDKKRRLERMNLRSENRILSRASNPQGANSSCKRSDSATNDSQKSARTTNSLDDRLLSEDKLRHIAQFEVEQGEELTEAKLEQRKNFEKCMRWMDTLPSKFSGMHIAQERAPVMKD